MIIMIYNRNFKKACRLKVKKWIYPITINRILTELIKVIQVTKKIK